MQTVASALQVPIIPRNSQVSFRCESGLNRTIKQTCRAQFIMFLAPINSRAMCSATSHPAKPATTPWINISSVPLFVQTVVWAMRDLALGLLSCFLNFSVSPRSRMESMRHQATTQTCSNNQTFTGITSRVRGIRSKVCHREDHHLLKTGSLASNQSLDLPFTHQTTRRRFPLKM